MEKKVVIPLTESQEKLAAANIRLAYFLKNKWVKNLHMDYEADEIESCCMLGLVKAARTYDTTKQTRFATYATRCMDNEVLMFIRQNKKHKAAISLYEPLTVDPDGNTLELRDIIPSGEFEEQIVSKIYIISKVEQLKTEREKGLLKLLNNGDTQHDIAATFGISQSYVSRLSKKLKKKIFEDLDQNGNLKEKVFK